MKNRFRLLGLVVFSLVNSSAFAENANKIVAQQIQTILNDSSVGKFLDMKGLFLKGVPETENHIIVDCNGGAGYQTQGYYTLVFSRLMENGDWQDCKLNVTIGGCDATTAIQITHVDNGLSCTLKWKNPAN